MPVLLTRETVDDFVQRAVAAAGDHELAAFFAGVTRNFCGVAGAARFGELGFDSALREQPACFVEFLAAAGTTSASVGIVNEKCVSQIVHSEWFLLCCCFITLA